MNQNSFKISDRARSFNYAFNGFRIMFIKEHNARLHLLAAIFVIVAGIMFRISKTDWIAIVIAIGLVFSTEAINTSIERLSDYVSPEKHMLIKEVKDLAAAGVLISAITALVTGLIVFVPKIILLFVIV